jgi:hypothetical protein
MRAPDYILSYEITAMGEARDETTTAEQSTAAAGPALGFSTQTLGFPTTFYLPDWIPLPLHFGSAGGRSVATLSMSALARLELTSATKVCSTPAVAKPCQPMAPAMSVAMKCQLFPSTAAKNQQCTSSSQSTTTSSSSNQLPDEASWKLTKPGLWDALALIFPPRLHLTLPGCMVRDSCV